MDLPSINQPTNDKNTSMTGWWYTYPLKNMRKSVGITIPNMMGKSFKIPRFQSPPTR